MMAQNSNDLALRISYWFAVHRDQLRTWWAISIIVIDLALLMYFIIAFTGYSFSTIKTVRQVSEMSSPLVTPVVREAIAPDELDIGDPVALSISKGHFDFVAPVKNPNAGWAAVEVRYRFSYGTATREEKTTLWPGSSAFLSQFNVVLDEPPAGTKPTIELTGVDWQRPPDRQLFEEVRFTTTNNALRTVSGLSTGGVATRFTATIKNESVYSFRTARFGVVLKSGGGIVAAGEAIIERFMGLEERPVEVTWLRSLPLSAEAVVYPVVDLLDPSAFL